MKLAKEEHDFSHGSVVKNIWSLAVPMTLAQLVNVLYNIVDRIYIGMIPENATLSMTGLGPVSYTHLGASPPPWATRAALRRI